MSKREYSGTQCQICGRELEGLDTRVTCIDGQLCRECWEKFPMHEGRFPEWYHLDDIEYGINHGGEVLL